MPTSVRLRSLRLVVAALATLPAVASTAAAMDGGARQDSTPVGVTRCTSSAPSLAHDATALAWHPTLAAGLALATADAMTVGGPCAPRAAGPWRADAVLRPSPDPTDRARRSARRALQLLSGAGLAYTSVLTFRAAQSLGGPHERRPAAFTSVGLGTVATLVTWLGSR